MIYTKKIYEDAILHGFIPIPLNGKKPKIKKWTSRTMKDARKGFKEGDNVGIRTGKCCRIIVLDIDKAQGGLRYWKRLIKKYGDILTPCVRTGSGGLHYYFIYQTGLKSTSRVLQENGEPVGIDIKTDGGQVVYPGSIHPDTGEEYVWIRSIADTPLQPIPSWLAVLLGLEEEKEEDAVEDDKEKEDKEEVKEDKKEEPRKTRKFVLVENAEPIIKNSSEKANELSSDEIDKVLNFFYAQLPQMKEIYQFDKTIGTLITLKRLKSAHCSICNREHDGDNAYLAVHGKEYKVRFYCRRNEESPLNLFSLFPDRDDVYTNLIKEHEGPANLIINIHKDNIKALHSKGPIYVYNEKSALWEECDIDQFSTMISAMIEPTYKEKIKDITDTMEICKKQEGGEKSEDYKNLKKSLAALNRGKTKISNLSFSKAVASWIVGVLSRNREKKEFNKIPNLLPVKDKMVVNMKTGDMRARTREDLFTYEVPICYYRGKRSEFLEKFFAEIMLEDDKPEEERVKVNFLQRILGYSFTGECKEQIMVVLTGDEGSNGKSTLCNLIRKCMPDIVKSAHKSVIMKRNNSSSANPELHMLRDCRLVLLSETQQNEFIDEDMFKRMTGGDEVQSRNLFTNFINWSPGFVAWMVTNFEPKCSGDKATLRRILLFKFLARFVENPKLPHERKINKDVPEMWKDKDIMEAFLAFIIEGAMKYHQEGLNIPQEIIDNTAQYGKNMNSFEVFIEQDIDPDSKATDRTSADDLWKRYQQRCKDESLIPMSQKLLGRELGKIYDRGRSGPVYYEGLRLIPRDIHF